jgi:hypothetical protein
MSESPRTPMELNVGGCHRATLEKADVGEMADDT